MYVKLEETISSRITANYFCIKLGYKLKVTHEVEKWKRKSLSHVPLFVTHRLQHTRLLCPWDSPGKHTGVGCHPFSRGLGLWHCRQVPYCLSHHTSYFFSFLNFIVIQWQTSTCWEHLPFASVGAESCAAAAADLWHALKGVPVENETFLLQEYWWNRSLDS